MPNKIEHMGDKRTIGNQGQGQLGKFTKLAKADMPEDTFSVVQDVSRVPKQIDGYQCASMSLTGVS